MEEKEHLHEVNRPLTSRSPRSMRDFPPEGSLVACPCEASADPSRAADGHEGPAGAMVSGEGERRPRLVSNDQSAVPSVTRLCLRQSKLVKQVEDARQRVEVVRLAEMEAREVASAGALFVARSPRLVEARMTPASLHRLSPPKSRSATKRTRMSTTAAGAFTAARWARALGGAAGVWSGARPSRTRWRRQTSCGNESWRRRS